MKKLVVLSIFFLIIISNFSYKEDIKTVMGNANNDNNHYELIFDKENLNLRNLKLKMSIFLSNEHNIKKIYLKYPEKLKDYFNNKKYFSFDNNNFNDGIQRLKEEYNVVLKENYLYDELNNDICDITIQKVEIYASKDALIKFKEKYPNVIVKYLK